MLTAKLGENIINCYDGKYNKENLKTWASKNIILCPICNKTYEYCHGEINSPYFRHKEKETCLYEYYEPETQEHIRGKIALYEWIKKQNGITDVVLEGWISETKQRPDIMFKLNGMQYALEYQCSPISTDYHKRHELYDAAGIIDIWICGTDNFISKQEIGKSFRLKEMEKNTNYYFDSEYNLFLFDNLLRDETINNKIVTDSYYCNTIKYYSRNNREKISGDEITLTHLQHRNALCITGLQSVYIENNNIFLNDECMKKAQINFYIKESEKKERNRKYNKCNNFKMNIISTIKNRYDFCLDIMPSIEFGLKYSGRYYCLSGFENYPMLDFCKINYINGKAINIPCVSSINVEIDSVSDVIEFLENDLKCFVILAKERIKERKKRETKETNLKNNLELFHYIPLYLIFSVDNDRIPNNIKFKALKNISKYRYDNFCFGEELLKELKFLKRKNVEKFVLLIPSDNQQYRNDSHYWNVQKENYKSSIVEMFKRWGFSPLDFNTLLNEEENRFE